MASFSIAREHEVREPVESPTIVRLRSLADDGMVEAFSQKLRHPRFKTRFTTPHFYAWFRLGGKVYSEDASSLEALNAILEQDYLTEDAPLST